MRLIANLETIDRHVNQGALILKAFHVARENRPGGYQEEFLRGEFSGWRAAIHTEYHDCAEEIVDRVVAKTALSIPEDFRSGDAVRTTSYSWR